MKNRQPLVSVIIPTYNRANKLKKAILSVLEQTYEHIELIIVDDCSTDYTEAIVEKYKQPNMTYIKLPMNTNGRETRNRGIQESSGQFIAFLDSDDYWLPTKLENQMNYIRKHDTELENTMCFTNVVMEKRRKRKMVDNQPFYTKKTAIMDYILVERNIVRTSTYIVSAKLAKRTLFNPNLKKHQDWDFCMRLEQNGADFLFYAGAETIWSRDDRQYRTSVGNKYLTHSMEWLETNKAHLSKPAQAGFKSDILFPELLRRKQVKAIINLLYEGRKSGALSLKALFKKLLMMRLLFSGAKKV